MNIFRTLQFSLLWRLAALESLTLDPS